MLCCLFVISGAEGGYPHHAELKTGVRYDVSVNRRTRQVYKSVITQAVSRSQKMDIKKSQYDELKKLLTDSEYELRLIVRELENIKYELQNILDELKKG